MNYILILHNLLRWFILLAGLWAVIRAIKGLTGNRIYTGADKKAGLFFMIFFDLQLLLGLVLYFGNSWFSQLKDSGAAAMKNANTRFFAVEHALLMIVAWILVHVGVVAIKKSRENSRHKKMLIFFGIAFVLMLASIPWPFRAEVARPWFRGM